MRPAGIGREYRASGAGAGDARAVVSVYHSGRDMHLVVMEDLPGSQNTGTLMVTLPPSAASAQKLPD